MHRAPITGIVALLFCLCAGLLPCSVAAQPDTAATWRERILLQLRTIQQQAQQQALQAEHRFQTAEQVLLQSQEALAVSQSSGNAAAAQTASQAQARAKAALERARYLRDMALRSAERAHTAAQFLERQTFVEVPQASDALLALQTGKVRIDRLPQSSSADAADAAVLLRSGDTVSTAAASQVRFFLADGHSQLALEENTALSYRDSEQRTTLDLLFGRIRLAIEKWAKSFEVQTPTAVCAVRGTRFSVGHDSVTAITEVRVIEGVVDVRPRQAGSTTKAVPAGTRLLLHPDGQLQGPLPLDVSPDELLDSIF